MEKEGKEREGNVLAYRNTVTQQTHPCCSRQTRKQPSSPKPIVNLVVLPEVAKQRGMVCTVQQVVVFPP
jgi:hypothetical protein